MPLESTWKPGAQDQAKSLFGRPSRVLLAAWILARDNPSFSQWEAQRELSNHGVVGSVVAADLDNFSEETTIKMLKRTRAPDRRVSYDKLESDLWDAFAAIVDATLGPAESRTSQ